jgi:hypothetical protein
MPCVIAVGIAAASVLVAQVDDQWPVSVSAVVQRHAAP